MITNTDPCSVGCFAGFLHKVNPWRHCSSSTKDYGDFISLTSSLWWAWHAVKGKYNRMTWRFSGGTCNCGICATSPVCEWFHICVWTMPWPTMPWTDSLACPDSKWLPQMQKRYESYTSTILPATPGAFDALVMRSEHPYIVPVSLHAAVVHLAHDTHKWVVRTKQMICEIYWWPQMEKLVDSVVATCLTCRRNDKSAKTSWLIFRLPDKTWEKSWIGHCGPLFLQFCSDFVGPLQQTDGGSAWLVCNHWCYQFLAASLYLCCDW